MRQKIPRFVAMAFIVAATACGGGSGPPASSALKPPPPAVTFQARLDSPDVSGDFDEVQPSFLRHTERRIHLENPEL